MDRIHPAVSVLFPFSREQPLIGIALKAFIQQENNSPVLIRPDNPSGRLEDFIHARILIGVRKTVHPLPVKIVLQNLPFPADLRKTGSYDQRSDQLFPDQIDPLREDLSRNCSLSSSSIPVSWRTQRKSFSPRHRSYTSFSI